MQDSLRLPARDSPFAHIEENNACSGDKVSSKFVLGRCDAAQPRTRSSRHPKSLSLALVHVPQPCGFENDLYIIFQNFSQDSTKKPHPCRVAMQKDVRQVVSTVDTTSIPAVAVTCGTEECY